jgi:hypothetical protein
VTYRPISIEKARARLAARGTSAAIIDAMLAIAAYQKRDRGVPEGGGPTAKVSDSVERILARPPRTIGDFARDYAEHFEGAGRATLTR